MAYEQFGNDLSTGTTLSASIISSDTSLSVVSVSGMPTISTSPPVTPTPWQFRIRIDSEILLVTAISGTGPYTLTVSRAADGTTAASHSSGASVYHVLTAASIQAPGFQYAAFPASTAGYLVPVQGDFSTSGTVGSSTVSWLAHSVTLTDSATASTHLRRLKLASGYPGGSYNAIVYMQNNCVMENIQMHGLYVSDGTKLVTYTIRPSGTSGIFAYADKWPTETGTVANYTSVMISTPECWQKLNDTGSNLIYSVSRDGLNWVQIHSVSRTDYLTPSEVGVVWQSNNATHAASISWLSWSIA